MPALWQLLGGMEEKPFSSLCNCSVLSNGAHRLYQLLWYATGAGLHPHLCANHTPSHHLNKPQQGHASPGADSPAGTGYSQHKPHSQPRGRSLTGTCGQCPCQAAAPNLVPQIRQPMIHCCAQGNGGHRKKRHATSPRSGPTAPSPLPRDGGWMEWCLTRHRDLLPGCMNIERRPAPNWSLYYTVLHKALASQVRRER